MSILAGTVAALGRCRGVVPASNVSMMSIRAPQLGHGWSGLSGAVAAANSAGEGSGGRTGGGAACLISRRARSMFAALVGLLAKRP